MKRSKILMGIALVALLVAPRLMAMSSRKPPVTMLVAPARYTVLQVANDIISKRPAVLVAYQNLGDELSLQVWNKDRWVPVSMRDYEKASFMRIEPARIVLIAESGSLGERTLEEASTWCSQFEKIEVLQTTALLNRLGSIFNFSQEEWNWFAARYNCELDIENEEELNRSWYDQKGSQFREKEDMIKREKTPPRAEEIYTDFEAIEGDDTMTEEEQPDVEGDVETQESDAEVEVDEQEGEMEADVEEQEPDLEVDEDSDGDDKH